jgi:hypothetical protein
MTEPSWIRPGEPATLLWHTGMARGRDGVHRYQIAGPAFDQPPPFPHFVLAPAERDGFAERLYRGEAGLDDLREFLSACVLARGEMIDDNEFLAASAEAPMLPVLDGWRPAPRPLLPYFADIGAFIPGSVPLYVTAEAHAAAQRASEAFAVAWVCEECGQADDAAVFLWTEHHADTVAVCCLIQNDVGVWTLRPRPFDFAREPATAGDPA